MAVLQVYLTFNGNCREAMTFYHECLGGDLQMQSFGDSPMGAETEEAYKNHVMHSSIMSNGIVIMASDNMPGQTVNIGENVSLSLGFDDIAEQEAIFNKLSAGGTITMPLQDQFWGARFGMFTDKFGLCWMANCELNK